MFRTAINVDNILCHELYLEEHEKRYFEAIALKRLRVGRWKRWSPESLQLDERIELLKKLLQGIFCWGDTKDK